MEVFKKLLDESGYDKSKSDYLIEGFSNGFSLRCEGLGKVRRNAPNLKLRIGNKVELWNKVMKEVQLERYAGPFAEPPFEFYVQSPIGLVPKDTGKKTRLIFHLSYPRSGGSVNANIPKQYTSVKYPDFDEAVKLCIQAGIGCSTAKSDMSSAFRHVPLAPEVWPLMLMKAEHPVTGKVFYFVDKCLPFGSSISCAIFQDFSNAIAHLVSYRTKKANVNYLDDFFFAHLLRQLCNVQVEVFLDICSSIQFPVALEKTFWADTIIVFLGLLIDTQNQMVCIPEDKVKRALELIEFVLNKANKKITVLQAQKLCGFLNFLCRCVVPGRAFLTRLYVLTPTKLKPHHHVRITQENRLDLKVWKQFLQSPEVYCRPFIDYTSLSALDIDMYSDASRHFEKGFGAFCGSHWCYGQWDSQFMESHEPSIQYLELFGVTVAVVNWLRLFKNKRICLFCDNQSVVQMINNSSARCKNCMFLTRIITLASLENNTRVQAKYVPTFENDKADALSRLQLPRFWRVCKENGDVMDEQQTAIPDHLWPLEKIWIN